MNTLKRSFLWALSGGVGLLNAAEPNDVVPVELFITQPELEVTLWAATPMFYNPTNIDIDKAGRIWVAEGVNYRGNYGRKPEGDRIVVIEDNDGDGKADKNWTFVQEPFLRCPMGVAVLDNKIVVSMTPDLVVYTDIDRDLVFEPGVDTREVLLTGFNGRVHDHSLHSVTVGPDGQWYWNSGNCGAVFTDRSGQTFRIGSSYDPYYGRKAPGDLPWGDPRKIAGKKSDDGHVYLGGFTARMNPDGTVVRIIGHNYRNSYEQTVTSLGDVFQNDNDDPAACRTTFLLEFGNAGFCSPDGLRSWQVDRRPGQSTPVAEWRQEDPGTMPSGDVYGGGAPTGIVFYENGALGSKFEGMLLSSEPARNTIFGYFPKLDGAGFELERFDFVTTNPEREFAGADFKGGERSMSSEIKTLFRPSDVAVGADGAVYIADFYDPRVGGHADYDQSLSGAIYRVAPIGFRPVNPSFDLETIDGQVAALKSPAVNVRSLGRQKLRDRGVGALPAVSKLLEDPSPFIQGRAIWLLSLLGPEGIQKVEELLDHKDAPIRVAAYRALRRAGHDFLEISTRMAVDPSPAVRREVGVAMRDVGFEESKEILQAIAARFDGSDRTYLEAFGTGCTGKESEIYDLVHTKLGSADSVGWSDVFAWIAWRLHPSQTIADFRARALSDDLTDDWRKASVTALGYIGTADAAEAILDIAEKTMGATKNDAMWWLLNRKDSLWSDYGLNAKLPPLEQILALTGDPTRGKLYSTACYMCHRIEGTGVDVGPELTGWAKTQTSKIVVQSIIDPSADIAHGYGASEIVTDDGITIHGIVHSDSDPVIVQSQGGLIQMVPKAKVKSQTGLGRSLMLTAEQLGMNAQAVADLAAYLKSI